MLAIEADGLSQAAGRSYNPRSENADRPRTMPATPEQLFARLDALGIGHTTTRHAAAYTVEQGNEVWGTIPGVHCKNLFLKDAKARLWLVVAPAERRVDLKTLPGKIGSARLSFGSAALMAETLGVTPGSVTPFGLINDAGRRVSLVVDAALLAAEPLNFHPLVNTATTAVSREGFLAFLAALRVEPMVVDFSADPATVVG